MYYKVIKLLSNKKQFLNYCIFKLKLVLLSSFFLYFHISQQFIDLIWSLLFPKKYSLKIYYFSTKTQTQVTIIYTF